MTVFNTLSETDLAISASKRLKQSGKALLTLQSFINNALNDLADKICWDQQQRYLLMTDQSTVTASITDTGSRYYASLSDVISNYGVMLDAIRLGTVMFMPTVTVTPYVLSGGTYASGYWTFNANPQHNETIAVNGVTCTFKYVSLIVSGAGVTALNGEYTFDGIYEGYPSYRGESDEIIRKFEGTIWQHTDTLGEVIYTCESAAYFPYDAVGWGANDPSDLPAPTYTAEAATGALTDIEIESTFADTKANFIAALNASANASINVATYSAGVTRTQAIGTYDTLGTGGNAFTLANSSFGSITRSGATFTGGVATAYALSISSYTDYFDDLTRVQFTTTGSLPTGISASTNYYLTDYTIDGTLATFGLSSTADGLTPVVISSAGSGVLTMQSYTPTVAQWLMSPNQGLTTPAIPIDYTYIWLEQNLLYTNRNAGVFAFTVPYVPTLATLPAQLTNDLVDCIVNIAVTAGFEPKAGG
jgi:hypothetical protein